MNKDLQIQQEAEYIARHYAPERRFLLAILQDIQRHYKYLPEAAMEKVAEYLSVPVVKVYAMATFYKAFSLTPKGKYIIKVCDGTACHIAGSMDLLAEIKAILGLEPGETTADGLFSLETVACIGACGLAPVAVINEQYYGNLTPLTLRKILAGYQGGVAKNA
jgi:NADH-quinone oxidoreductase subunit E